MCLGENIRYLRKKANMSQEQLADALGYKSYTTIQKWESGVSEPPLKALKKMADMFGADMDQMTEIRLMTDADRFWEYAQEYNKRNFPDDNKGSYYTNPETAELAQQMYEDPDMQSLFHMKKNMDPERFKLYMSYIEGLYKLEHPEE